MRCRTLDVSSCWTYTSSQAFRFGTGGDMVDTHIHKHTDTTHHSSALHRSSLPASQRANIPSLPPKDLARLTVPYIATVAMQPDADPQSTASGGCETLETDDRSLCFAACASAHARHCARLRPF